MASFEFVGDIRADKVSASLSPLLSLADCVQQAATGP